MKIDPNAPAFSRAGVAFSSQEWDEGAEGISIRTWLAGMAMQGLLACPLSSEHINIRDKAEAQLYFARPALGMADALIAELNKEPAP